MLQTFIELINFFFLFDQIVLIDLEKQIIYRPSQKSVHRGKKGGHDGHVTNVHAGRDGEGAQ